MNEKNKKSEEKQPQEKKRMVAIRAEKVELKHPNGLWRVHTKGDIIKEPWPELMQMAELDTERRVFAIIEK